MEKKFTIEETISFQKAFAAYEVEWNDLVSDDQTGFYERLLSFESWLDYHIAGWDNSEIIYGYQFAICEDI